MNHQTLNPRMTAKVGAVMALWVIVLFSLHWFLLARGAPQGILKAQTAAATRISTADHERR